MPELDQYDYSLPKELIAQFPVANRADARLLVVEREQKRIEHWHVRDLPEILSSGDCLVLNDTRVIPARLVGRRTSTGGRWQGLFLEEATNGLWKLLCKARGRLWPGETIQREGRDLRPSVQLQLGARLDEGIWVARAETDEETIPLLERIGRIPLPPYIRGGEMVSADRDAYQTVFAAHPGSVAAPTAGLPFSELLLKKLSQRGVDVCHVTLHIGRDTFRPIRTKRLEDHSMHQEWGSCSVDLVRRLQAVRAGGGRIVAVGTTSVRVLETSARSGELVPWQGMTDLFIRPPHTFSAVDALMTNFHLPRTSLLVLVRTFGGDELMQQAYAAAIGEKYRFYSYGDAMLVL